VKLQRGDGPITYGLVYQMFHDAAQAAGITKHIGTHLFRASRITHLVEQGLPENTLKETIWGNQGTDMMKTYVKMSPVELDKALLRHQGIIVDEDLKARVIEGKTCPECGAGSLPTADFCSRCGVPFPSYAKYDSFQKFMKTAEKNHADMIEESLIKMAASQT
jgi:hypothetical protein